MPNRTHRKQGRKLRARRLSNKSIPVRSLLARDRALHALAAMRRDPSLSLTRAAKMQGVKRETIKRHFPSALNRANGKFRATETDHYAATLYVPDAQGNPVPVNTKNSKQRAQVSAFLRDVGRFYRGDLAALDRWQGKRIAGVELITSSQTLKSVEAQLSDFAIYSTFNGGAD
jgi:hypothetical protein